jgi:hypothetical protein
MHLEQGRGWRGPARTASAVMTLTYRTVSRTQRNLSSAPARSADTNRCASLLAQWLRPSSSRIRIPFPTLRPRTRPNLSMSRLQGSEMCGGDVMASALPISRPFPVSTQVGSVAAPASASLA